MLAAAGLLDGKRATTHWALASELGRRYPKVSVEADAIYVRDGNVYTSAGVTTGIDLALSLIEEDHGRTLSLRVARAPVAYLKRPGGQSQFSNHLLAQFAASPPVRQAQEWALENLSANLSVRALAKRAGRGVRQQHFPWNRARAGPEPSSGLAARVCPHRPADHVVVRRCALGVIHRLRRHADARRGDRRLLGHDQHRDSHAALPALRRRARLGHRQSRAHGRLAHELVKAIQR
jgi:hypothetical protein